MSDQSQANVSRHQDQSEDQSLAPVSPRTTKRPAPGDASNPSNPQVPHPPPVTIPGTSTLPPQKSPPLEPRLPTGEIPIPATPFSASYLPRLFSSLTTLNPPLTSILPCPLENHFSHLACSYTSHPRAPAPTMEELKKHAQALCLLITTLSVHEEFIGEQNKEGHPSEVLNFLPNLLKPYESENKEEQKPLQTLRNTVATATEDADLHWPTGPESRLTGCPLDPAHIGEDNMGRYLMHANSVLEYIDNHYEKSGGLLACLPPEKDDDMREWAEQTLLGQWLAYTQNLVLRVAELEREVVGFREVLVGGNFTPPAVTRNDGGHGQGGGKEEESQNRYVLAGLTPALFGRLQSELDAPEAIAVTREQRARRRGFAAEGLRYRSKHRPSDDSTIDIQENWIPDNVVAWIECTSRIYRCQGDERLFVIPAWDIRPGAEAVRKIEREPLLISVPVRVPGQRDGNAAGEDGGGRGGAKGTNIVGNAGGLGSRTAGVATRGGGQEGGKSKPAEYRAAGPADVGPPRSGVDGGSVEEDLRKQLKMLQESSDLYRARMEEERRQNNVLRDSHERLRLEKEGLEKEKEMREQEMMERVAEECVKRKGM